jgi:hypothetical protein
VASPTIAKVTGIQTFSVDLRRSDEDPAFAQVVELNSFIVFGNFNLLDGSVGSKGMGCHLYPSKPRETDGFDAQ